VWSEKRSAAWIAATNGLSSLGTPPCRSTTGAPPRQLGGSRRPIPARPRSAPRGAARGLRAQFDADYLAALDEARSTFRLDRLHEVIQAWWLSGWARRSPRHAQAMETGRRFLAGEPVSTFPVDPDALRPAR
jgi:hypothetical protein